MVTNKESKNETRKMDGNHLFLNFHQLGSRTHLGLILGLSVKGKPSDSSKNTSLWCVTNVGGFSLKGDRFISIP